MKTILITTVLLGMSVWCDADVISDLIYGIRDAFIQIPGQPNFRVDMHPRDYRDRPNHHHRPGHYRHHGHGHGNSDRGSESDELDKSSESNSGQDDQWYYDRPSPPEFHRNRPHQPPPPPPEYYPNRPHRPPLPHQNRPPQYIPADTQDMQNSDENSQNYPISPNLNGNSHRNPNLSENNRNNVNLLDGNTNLNGNNDRSNTGISTDSSNQNRPNSNNPNSVFLKPNTENQEKQDKNVPEVADNFGDGGLIVIPGMGSSNEQEKRPFKPVLENGDFPTKPIILNNGKPKENLSKPSESDEDEFKLDVRQANDDDEDPKELPTNDGNITQKSEEQIVLDDRSFLDTEGCPAGKRINNAGKCVNSF